MRMGSDLNLGMGGSPSSSSPTAKRTRDPEEDVYVDNLRSHKRYLTEIMASSLNGLTVGDSLPDNVMDSPARSESMFSLRDDMSLQYSPLSEDSDDSRSYDAAVHSCSSQPESLTSSPVSSPHRYQRSQNVLLSSAPSTSSSASHGSTLSTVTCSQPRQRGTDSEGRFPSSPSDICHSADLRRAALLRSVHMRTHPPGSASLELPFSSAREPVPNLDTEEQCCYPYLKSMDDEREYQIEECSPMSIPEPEFDHDNKPCRVLNMNVKASDP
ncbi:PREDICTED: cell wall protein RBR3-like [Lupinus angustifolius]|uniref:cell wall protein RBR3-like n=1 Tax=Lupinus angustifolius TaxID=3871 RepID=UPI00092F0013|nr:PREDICTED: cell wall protein RBR3-like [Lupinus angustifolius]